MKKIACTLLACLVLGLFSGGCGKTDNEGNEPAESFDRYYVRYEVGAKSIHYETVHVSVTTDSGNQSYDVALTPTGASSYNWVDCHNIFSETYGPVQKGFEARVSASTDQGVPLVVSIHVCRNGEAFVLKANNSGNTNCSASYQIDF